MRFEAVESSREWTEPKQFTGRFSTEIHCFEDVEAEALRRLRACRFEEWRTRECITGNAMPQAIRHFAVQVEFAARAISNLLPIPDDFDSDVYWPPMPHW